MRYLILLLTIFLTTPAFADTIVITIPDGISTRVIRGCAYRLGYKDEIEQPDGSLIPNPQNKKSYCRAQLRYSLITAVREYEVEKAGRDAEQVAKDKVKDEVSDQIP